MTAVGRPADRARHAGAARAAAQAPGWRRHAARLEGRLRRAGVPGAPQDHRSAGRLPDPQLRASIPAARFRLPAGRSRWPSPRWRCISAATLRPAADRETAAAAIAGISPAIELVDLDTPPEDPERILAGNIYQRHVVLGGRGPARAGGCSRRAHRPRHPARAARLARTSDPQANTGNWVDIVRHVADVLAGVRRAAARRRDHHHRLGGAADVDRAGRGRHRVRARPGRKRLRTFSVIPDLENARRIEPNGATPGARARCPPRWLGRRTS